MIYQMEKDDFGRDDLGFLARRKVGGKELGIIAMTYGKFRVAISDVGDLRRGSDREY